MRIALVADLHANLPALRAVTASAAELGCADIWVLGDVVGRGPHPNEVVDELRRLRLPTVLGNWDEAVSAERPHSGSQWSSAEAEAAGDGSLAWTAERLSEENRDWLRNLPMTHRLKFEDVSVLAFHGSPYRTTEYLWEDRPTRVFSRIAADEGDQLFAFGHGHQQFLKQVGAAQFMTPGAAGCPPDPGRAPWAVVDIEGNALSVHFELASYDGPSVAAALMSAGLDPALLAEAPLAHAAAGREG